MTKYSIPTHPLIVHVFECSRSNLCCRSNTKHGARNTWLQKPLRTGVEFYDDHVVFVSCITQRPPAVCNAAQELHTKACLFPCLWKSRRQKYCLWFVNIHNKTVIFYSPRRAVSYAIVLHRDTQTPRKQGPREGRDWWGYSATAFTAGIYFPGLLMARKCKP